MKHLHFIDIWYSVKSCALQPLTMFTYFHICGFTECFTLIFTLVSYLFSWLVFSELYQFSCDFEIKNFFDILIFTIIFFLLLSLCLWISSFRFPFWWLIIILNHYCFIMMITIMIFLDVSFFNAKVLYKHSMFTFIISYLIIK